MILHIGAFVPDILKQRWRERQEKVYFLGMREGTILFSDISGFTALTEKLMASGREGSEELTFLINKYFDRMIAIIYSYGGDIIKFGGDALLCYFGGQYNMSVALQAVKEMMNVVKKEYRSISTSGGKFTINMHCGLDRGTFWECAAGNEQLQMEYIIFGSPVARAIQLADAVSNNEAGLSSEFKESLSQFSNLEFQKEKGRLKIKDFSYRARKIFIPLLNESDSTVYDDDMIIFIPQPLRSHLAGSHNIGEHRKVCVCFIEISAASLILSKIQKKEKDPEKMYAHCAGLLSKLYAQIIALADTYEGTLLKTDMSGKGEKIILLFGAPIAHEDDEYRSMEVLRRVITQLKQINDEHAQTWGMHDDLFHARCGVTSGYVFWTLVGNDTRKEWTVMGDSVNLAARLMNLSAPWSIVLEESLMKKLPNYEWDYLGQFAVKGKLKELNVYKFKHEKMLYREVPHKEEKIVARTAELASLQEFVTHAAEGNKSLISMSGAAGIGKSVICTHVLNECKEKRINAYCISCQAYEMSEPYYAWRIFFNQISESNVTEELPTSGIENILYSHLQEYRKWIPVFKDIIDIEIKENNWTKNLTPKLRKSKIFDLMAKLIDSLSHQNTFMLIFDDAQWLDSVSLELIEYLFTIKSCNRFMILLSHRTEFDTARFRALPAFKAFELKELNDDEAYELVKMTIADDEKSAQCKAVILPKAQGNPLFIKLLAETLSRESHIDLKDIAVPDTISSMFLSLMDRMPREEKLFIKLAATMGKTFNAEDMIQIFNEEFSKMNYIKIMMNLEENDWMMTEKRNYYAFKYPLMQEVAYQSIPYSFKRQCHRRIADFYEQTARSTDKIIDYLAFHYLRSSNIHKAIDYTFQAGNKSTKLYILQQSNFYFSEVINLIEKINKNKFPTYVYEYLPPKQALQEYEFKTLVQWSDVLSEMGRMKQAIDKYEKAISKSHGLISACEKLRLKQKIAHNFMVTGNLKNASIIAINALHKAKELSYYEGIARSLNTLANVNYLLRKYQKALKYSKEAVVYARKGSFSRLLVDTYVNLSNIYSAVNRIDTAIRYAKKSVAISIKTKNKYGISLCYNNTGCYYHMKKDYSRALYYYKKSLAICKQLDDSYGISLAYRNFGEVYFEKNRVDEALENFLKAYSYTVEFGFKILEAVCQLFLSAIYARKNEYERSMQYLINAEDFAKQVELKEELMIAYYWIAIYCNSVKSDHEAQKYLDKLSRLVVGMDDFGFYYKIYFPRIKKLQGLSRK